MLKGLHMNMIYGTLNNNQNYSFFFFLTDSPDKSALSGENINFRRYMTGGSKYLHEFIT